LTTKPDWKTAMKSDVKESDLNRRKQRQRSSLFTLLTPVKCFVFATLFVGASARAQCYIDPYSGQQICMRPNNGCPTCPQPARRIVSESPDTDTNSANVDSSAHCRITVADGTTGSGTLIASSDKVGLILTCAHLFDTCRSQITVSFGRAGRFMANLVDVDKANDLAAIEIRHPVVEPLDVSDADPAGTLTACGFGSNGAFRSIRGRIVGTATADGASFPSIKISGAVRPGDSGGGVLDIRGKLVGIIWGTRDNQTYTTCGRPVRDFVARVRVKVFGTPVIADKPTSTQPPAPPAVPSPELDWKIWTAELDARMRALDAKKQDKGEYLQAGDLNGYLRAADASKIASDFPSRTEIEAKLKGVVAQFDSVHGIVESVRQHVEEIAGDRASIAEGASIAKYAVGALGLSGPVAAAVILAGGLFGRRIASRLKTLESRVGIPTLNSQLGREAASTLNPYPVAVDSPPPPQRTVPETHYVPFEKDSYAKAHQWASEHVARKYPGATEVLQTQDSLIKQFLAAK
jgi:hypothetical protein